MITATREIRALGYTAPIFGVTGNSLPTDVAHFKLHGADVVLIKPLDIDDFKRAMQGEKDRHKYETMEGKGRDGMEKEGCGVLYHIIS